jgi:hypothetical protein
MRGEKKCGTQLSTSSQVPHRDCAKQKKTCHGTCENEYVQVLFGVHSFFTTGSFEISEFQENASTYILWKPSPSAKDGTLQFEGWSSLEDHALRH